MVSVMPDCLCFPYFTRSQVPMLTSWVPGALPARFKPLTLSCETRVQTTLPVKHLSNDQHISVKKLECSHQQSPTKVPHSKHRDTELVTHIFRLTSHSQARSHPNHHHEPPPQGKLTAMDIQTVLSFVFMVHLAKLNIIQFLCCSSTCLYLIIVFLEFNQTMLVYLSNKAEKVMFPMMAEPAKMSTPQVQ